MANQSTLSVLRIRNANYVTYFRDFQDEVAMELRAKNPHLKHAHLYHYPVTLHFPECLFTGKLIKRDSDYCQYFTEHKVFLVENGTFASYYKTLNEANQALEIQPELAGSQVTEVSVKLQDIEALCHGQPTAILSDELREKLFNKSMTSILHPDAKEKMALADNYQKAEQTFTVESPLGREIEATQSANLKAVA